MHDRQAQALRDGDRKRIIELLEELSDADHKEQCPLCGDYFKGVSQHKTHCDGVV